MLLKKTFNPHFKKQHSLHMQVTPDDGLRTVRSARDNFGKFIHQFQPETKTLIKKLERILIKSYWQSTNSI